MVFDGQGGNGGNGGSGGNDPNCDCTLAAYFPVCGVDGQTYNAVCGDACVPVEIACRNECPCAPSCEELPAAYASILETAKACVPGVREPCTLVVDDAFPCPCAGTFVSDDNPEVSSYLDEVRSAWERQSCGDPICPAVACQAPIRGECAEDPMEPGVFRCQDVFE